MNREVPKATVLITEDIPDSVREELERCAYVRLCRDDDRERLYEAVGEASAMLVRSGTRIDAEFLQHAVNMRVLARTGAGVDNIDVGAASARGIMVCNLPGLNKLAVAEHTLALVFALLKSLKRLDSAVRNGEWSIRRAYLPVLVQGKRVGIVGFGQIGREVARLCAAVGMEVFAYDPYVTIDTGSVTVCESIDDLLRQVDIVTIHVPNTAETAMLIEEREFSLMREGSFLINCGRSETVSSSALVKALKSGRLAGAAIDVFSPEPPEAGDPLIREEALILSPHVAALAREMRERAVMAAVEQIISVLEGGNPVHLVNGFELGMEAKV